MIYSERAFFHGDHCQHVADRDEAARLARANRHVKALRPITTRVADVTDAAAFPNIALALREHAARSPERRAELNADWEA